MLWRENGREFHVRQQSIPLATDARVHRSSDNGLAAVGKDRPS